MLLKSNIKTFLSNPDISAGFHWNSNNKQFLKFYMDNAKEVLLCNTVFGKNYIVQFLGAQTSNKSTVLWLTLSNSFHSWFKTDFSLLTNPHHINQYIISNSSIAFVSHFFNFNRFSSYTKIPVDIDTFNSNIFINSNMNALENLVHTKKFCSNLVFKNNIFIKTKKQSLLRVLRMLFRYVPTLTLKNVFRQKKIERKTFSYIISQKEYDYGRLIRVNERYKELSILTLCCQNNGKVLHATGLPTLLSLLSNDNCFELSYDENLHRTNLLKLPHSLYNLLQIQKNNIFQYINRSLSNYYREKTLATKRTVSISRQYLSKATPSNILLPLSQTILNDVRLINQLYNNPLLFKYLFFNNGNRNNNIHSFFSKTSVSHVLKDLTRFNFSSRLTFYQNSNMWPASIFKYAVRRKILKVFTYNKFLPNVTMWYYNTLIRFMENCSGKKVYLKFNPFIENSLTFSDLARCQMWMPRLWSFQKLLGHRIFINESLKILHVALRFKDPVFLSNWIKSMLYRLSFWKYRLLFRYIKYAMRYLFWIHFAELNFKGLKLKLKGKISVAGNARTRTLVYKIGETSHATVNNKVLSHFTTINTFTGVMGFRMWFYF